MRAVGSGNGRSSLMGMNRSRSPAPTPVVRPAGAGFSPLDESLALLPGHHLTPSLVEGIVRLGVLVPFAQVPPLIAHFTGVTVSVDTVRRLTEAAGAVQAARELAAVEQIERTLPDPPAGPARQLLSVDGAMVPLVGGEWSEVKMLAIGTIVPDPTDPAQVMTGDLSYFARLADVASFTRWATVETHHRGTETAQTVAAVVDGAIWCQGFIDHQRHDAVRILDFAHVLEHLSTVAKACFGAGTPETSEWLGQQAHALRHGDEETVISRLASLATAGSPEAREVAQATHGYLSSRLDQIRYQTFAAAGYPIGSGCVESANKLVVEARLKGSGMHWSRAAVNPMLALRTLVANQRWDATWPALWLAWREQARQQATDRRQRRQAAVSLAIPLDEEALNTLPEPDPAEPTPPPAPRPKTIVDGKPTADHIWRKSSPFRAKR